MLKGNHWYVGYHDDEGDGIAISSDPFATYDAALAHAKSEQAEYPTFTHFVFYNPTVIAHKRELAVTHHFTHHKSEFDAA